MLTLECNNEQTVNTIVKDSNPGSLELAAGHPREEIILAVHCSGGNEVEETKDHIFASEDRLLNENVLVCPEEKRCNPEAEKVQAAQLFSHFLLSCNFLLCFDVRKYRIYCSLSFHVAID